MDMSYNVTEHETLHWHYCQFCPVCEKPEAVPKNNFLFSFNQINGTQAIYATYSDYVLFHLRDEACMLIPSMCTSGGTVLFWTYLPPSCGSWCGIVSTIRTKFTLGFHIFYTAVIQYVSTKVTCFNKIILFLFDPSCASPLQQCKPCKPP